MKLIIGLGNPGKQYERTRHNIGFMVLDEIAKNFKLNKKLEAEITKEKDVIFAKPQTFMNESGRAVAKIIKFYKMPLKNIYIIHDDKDLNFGTLRIRPSGSSAGHKGVQSIIEHLRTQNFTRFRVGIKNPLIEKMDTADFVLSNFSRAEQKKLPEIIKAVISALNKK